MVTYTKILPKMVNPRDRARNTAAKEKETFQVIHTHSTTPTYNDQRLLGRYGHSAIVL